MNYPEKDNRWEAIVSLNELEDFRKLSDDLIQFEINIPEDVTKSFNLVKKLIEYSYFEYEFLDAALERTLINFELALRKRFIDVTDITKKEAKDRDLDQLINWANSKSYIEVDKERVHALRRFRNSSTHRYSYQLAGFNSIDLIPLIVQWINDLYDSVDLRIERKRKKRKITKDLRDFNKKGGTLHMPAKQVMVTNIELIYFDNKNEDQTYTFIFDQYFELPIDKDKHSEMEILDGLSIPPPITLTCKDFKIESDSVIFLPPIHDKIIQLKKNSVKKSYHIIKWKKFIHEKMKIFKGLLSAKKAKILDKIRIK